MAKKKNSYAQKAQRASFTKNMFAPNNLKFAAKETLIDTAVGAILGAAVGAAVGKPALLVGIGVSAVGHITGQRWVSMLGVGMMASNTYQTATVSGVEGLDGVKERMKVFQTSLKDRLYLDKFIKKTTTPVAGVGDLQYFSYPNEVGYTDDLNGGLAALNSVEQQMEESAMNRLQGAGLNASQVMETMEGGLSDITDYNL